MARQDELDAALGAAVIESTGDAVVACSLSGTISSWNPAAERLFGYAVSEVLDQPSTLLFLPAAGPDVRDRVARASRGEATRHWDTAWVHRDGTRIDVGLTVAAVCDGSGDVGAVTLIARDQTERTRFEKQLAHRAYHDGLTELPNRSLFADRLESALTRTSSGNGRRDESVAVLIIDLDGFKFVNDSGGHAAGDALLVSVAERLATCVRTPDTVARLGGDEFAVLLERAATRDAVAAAERILAEVARPLVLDGRVLRPQASIGIATSDGSVSADELVRDADLAMYVAKARGKGRCQVFEPAMHAALVGRMQLQVELDRALENEEFELHYQPVLDTRTGTVVSVEALVRWRHPIRGLVFPDQFVPLAEETGLIGPLGAWVLREACAELARLRSTTAAELTMAVNLSVVQLCQPDIVGVVAGALGNNGLKPEDLILELTESALMQQDELSLAALSELRALGVRVAIDDFGTGYSSLARLRTLPVTQLKIDRSFIDEIDTMGERAPVVAAVVAMARAVNLEVVAEGVETSSQLYALARLGCDHVQGFLFSRALPVGELRELLTFAVPFAAEFTDAARELMTAEVDTALMEAVTAVMRGDGDLEQLVRPLLAELERVTGLESTYLTHIDWRTSRQEIRFSRNVGELMIPEGLQVDWEDSLCRRVLLGGPSVTDNVPGVYPDSKAARALGLQTYASVPVSAPDGTVWGTLCGASERPQAVDDGTQRVMELFARLIAERVGDSVAEDGQASIRVVVADDSAVARRVLRAVLERDGRFDMVGEATNGQEAVELAAREQPDVVTLDLEMPVLNGRAALTELRRACPSTAVVIFTGHPLDEVIDELRLAGAVAILPKHASPDQITRAIQAAHRSRSSSRDSASRS